jgi:lysozyme family protein
MPKTQDQVITEAIDAVIEREGGYVDRVEDRGGPTKFGVTQTTLDRARGLALVATKSVKDLTVQGARTIYRVLYVDEPRFCVIRDPDLFELVIDRGINMNPVRAVKWLQAALGVKEDGILGPKTQAALEYAEATGRAHLIYRSVLADSVMYLGRLISKDERDADHDGKTDSAEFASGWLNRSAGFIRRTP